VRETNQEIDEVYTLPPPTPRNLPFPPIAKILRLTLILPRWIMRLISSPAAQRTTEGTGEGAGQWSGGIGPCFPAAGESDVD